MTNKFALNAGAVNAGKRSTAINAGVQPFARRAYTRIELVLDYCKNRYGVSPCTAGRKSSGTAQPAYLSLPGTAGNYASTPDSAAVSITGDVDIRVRVAMEDWTPRTEIALIGKYRNATPVDRSYLLTISDTSIMRLYVSTDNVTLISAESLPLGFIDGSVHWVRATRDAATGEFRFFTSEDGQTWTQISATTLEAGAIYDGATPVEIGSFNSGGTYYWPGKIYYAEIRNGIDGPVVARFDPANDAQHGSTTFVSSTGETWTINQSGTDVARIVGGRNALMLSAAAVAEDAYNTMTVRLTGGTGAGQERKVTDYTGATRVATVTPAWTTAPDATSTYTVIDRPNACYNTYKNCQDKPNYVKGARVLRFISRGAELPPGRPYLPYIKDARLAPTQIDPEAGLARRGVATITFADEPGPDTVLDPYHADRAQPAVGTFWARFRARYHNYVGRFARLDRIYITDSWSSATTRTELYIIDRMDAARDVSITLKDPLKLSDFRKIPIATNGKLASAVLAGAGTLPLTSGDGAQYDVYGYPCYVRIGDEIIKITSRTTDTLNVATGGRGAWGTTDKEHKADDNVQLCRHFENARIKAILPALLNDCGIDNSYIDTAGITKEDDDWLGANYQTSLILSTPEEGSKILADLAIDCRAALLWHALAQQVRFKVIGPKKPKEPAVPLLTESAHLIDGSVAVKPLDNLRLTRSAIYFGLSPATASAREPANFLRGEINIDTNAESAQEYNDVRDEVRFSRVLSTANAAAARQMVARKVASRRDAPEVINFKLDLKDEEIDVGALRDISTSLLTDERGAAKTVRCLITKVEHHEDHVACEARTTTYGFRYCFIAPAGTPDYASADDDQREYGFISNNSGLMSDGSEYYRIN